MVEVDKISKYKRRFDLDDNHISLRPVVGPATWNPSPGMVAIYGAMLTYGVTIPLQPFIALFLSEAQISTATGS